MPHLMRNSSFDRYATCNQPFFCPGESEQNLNYFNYHVIKKNSLKLLSSKSSARSIAAGHVGQNSSAQVAHSVAAIWTLIPLNEDSLAKLTNEVKQISEEEKCNKGKNFHALKNFFYGGLFHLQCG